MDQRENKKPSSDKWKWKYNFQNLWGAAKAVIRENLPPQIKNNTKQTI